MAPAPKGFPIKRCAVALLAWRIGAPHGPFDAARSLLGMAAPVDVLEISGDIDDKRAQSMEDLIWSLIPEAQHLRQNVGHYIDDKNRPAMSHPLALSQLLITYHMVKAALGHHAV